MDQRLRELIERAVSLAGADDAAFREWAARFLDEKAKDTETVVHRSLGFEDGVKLALGRAEDPLVLKARAALAKKKELDDAIALATSMLDSVASGSSRPKRSSGPPPSGPEVGAFRGALESGAIDPEYPETPVGHAPSGAAAIVDALVKSSALAIERFADVASVEAIAAKAGADAVVVREELCAPGQPEVIGVARPLVLLGDELIQPAVVRKGIRIFDPDVVTLDRLLADVELRLTSYAEGAGKTIEAKLDERERTLLPRTVKRIAEVRTTMLDEVKKSGGKKSPLPTKTSIRDLVLFVVDQVHRYDDALALLADKAHRASWAEGVFKDVVFRSCAPFLSQTQGISIDTAVVAGADTGALAGRFKKETTGPKPTRESNIIFSVVIPAYVQGGVCIRPALVRVGEYAKQ